MKKEYIEKSKNIQQDLKWHPENEVYIHTRIVYDRALATGDINLALAAFFHDLGKVDTSTPNKRGGISAIGHERVSAKLVEKYTNWINEIGGDSEEVKELVSEHMRIKFFKEMRKVKQEEMRKLPTFDKLNLFTSFDDMKTLTSDELNRYKYNAYH